MASFTRRITANSGPATIAHTLRSLGDGPGRHTIARFQSVDFAEPAHVTLFVGKFGVAICFDKFLGQCDTDNARAQHEHVHLIVLHALMRGISIVAEAGADSRQLVGGYRSADA